ncbi:hypothetical protein E5D57_003546 [Metarhizium anisopliae]|nr:hypothetical protein E5D57_003546 [Metarhizium anisopliae]
MNVADPTIEKRVNDAIQYLNTNPTAKKRAVAKKFNISRQRLDRRVSGILPKFGRHARNAKLSEPEEVALCRYIDRLDKMNLSIRKEFIRDAANLILRGQASPVSHRDPPTVGQHWVDRFIKRHKYSVLPQRIREVDRQNAETIRNVTTYFEQLYDCITDHGIVESDIWNMDETGFRIGMGKSRMVVTRRPRASYLATIESVRRQAFKVPTIQSAFRKTGIVPWNPQPILDQIQALHPSSPREVTTPPPNNLSSSPFDTPYTARHLNKVASKIEDLQEALGELQPALKTEMDRFIRGALVQSTELRQTMRDLARTKMAEDLRKQRKVGKNRPLQSGGVITVSDGRRMVRQSDKNALEAARLMVERAATRSRNALKRQFEATAKIARKKRLDGVLEPLYIVDAEGCGRYLRRG